MCFSAMDQTAVFFVIFACYTPPNKQFTKSYYTDEHYRETSNALSCFLFIYILGRIVLRDDVEVHKSWLVHETLSHLMDRLVSES